MVDFYGDVDPAVEMWNTLFTDVVNTTRADQEDPY